jgi:hypothetical protein
VAGWVQRDGVAAKIHINLKLTQHLSSRGRFGVAGEGGKGGARRSECGVTVHVYLACDVTVHVYLASERGIRHCRQLHRAEHLPGHVGLGLQDTHRS